MTMFLAPYTAIADIDGSPLDAGFLFFGEYNKDPELFPVPVYWDADFTVPATQPIRTRNGYPVRNGSPTKVYLKTAQHSIVIKNRNSAFILVDFKNKGWDASFVVDESGKNQQQINDASNNVYTKLFGLTSSEVLDQTEIVQAAANVAKLMRKNLVINTLVSPAVVRLQEVDITGINVYVQKDILIKGVTKGVSSNDTIFKAIGSRESYAEGGSLDGANYDAEDITRCLFRAMYVKQPVLSNAKTANLSINTFRSGFFQYCDSPTAVDCQTHGGVSGVVFYGCKKPRAIRVTTDYSGYSGISFLTVKGEEDLTTEALAQDCKVTRFTVLPDSNHGRAGIHFYGVRKGTALNCTIEDDSVSVHGFGNAGIRFRDCEDFYADSYHVENCEIGVLVSEIGDFSSPHGIITRGNIGSGSVNNIRLIGVGVDAPRPIDCNIVGAKVDGVSASSSAGAGIYHNGVGSIVGCTVRNIPDTAGINARGIINVAGNTSINCGNAAFTVPHLRLSNGASASGNTFADDRTIPVSTVAIRAIGGKVTIGQNNYSDGISTTLLMNASSTLSKDSATHRSNFVTISLGGDVENGCTAINSQHVQFIYNDGWKRVSLKKVTATVGTSETIIPHGLKYTPSVVTLLPKGNFVAWQSANADETNIYLTASADLSQVEVGCQ